MSYRILVFKGLSALKVRDKLFLAFGLYLLVVISTSLVVYYTIISSLADPVALEKVRIIFLVTIFFLLAAGYVLGTIISRTITVPLKKLERTIKNISMGDLTDKTGIEGHDEIGSLGNSFDQMLERLRDTYNFLEVAVQMLQEKQDLLVENEKLASLGRLAAGVAHEINNPLAIINEKSGLMKDFIEFAPDFPNKEKFLELTQGISDSVSRCRAITHHLLGYARPIEIVKEFFSMENAVNEVLVFLKSEIVSKKIVVETRFDKDSDKIKSDKVQIEQVLLNIIKDAVDAVAISGSLSIWSDRKNDETARIFIKDNGHGISRDMLKHIFEPFFSTKERGKGTGLGLFVSYGIVKKLGGKILVESELNKGTTFTIELPFGYLEGEP